ncbi:CG7337 [Drosophila busckii]|uniref:CG7337 n=1 Tax=Drosophila busckii TaxID=30019 RepID=A0A0M3QSZ6_DROBS|nr:CG7337 [Drosophila busckii]
MRHLIMTPTSLSMSTPTLSSLHHQRMMSQSQLTLNSQSQSQSPSPLTPQSASPSFFGINGSPKFPANYERSDKIKLKRVLGLTVCSNAALDVSPVSGLLAYPAGCTVVLFNARRHTQAYLVNTSRKAFTSVAFSRCGRYVATGECGINPAIKVWELETPNGNLEHCSGGNVVAEFVDHKNAVTCVAFSPTGKYLVSVGSQHDMIVNVFDWRANLKMASNKISSRVAAVCFAEDGSYFVTVGNRHVKYWYLEGGRKYKDPIPLMGRSAILGDLRDNDFCAVACGKGICSESTYAITRQGHLVEFSSRRLLDKWVQCRTNNANCICVNERFILVGCAESIIRIFNAATLEYVTTLPRTHYLGVDVAQGIQINHIMSVPQQAKFPDCIAMVFDEQRSKVSCVYNDHSLYIWDVRDLSRVGKSHSFLYHSTCIWGVETVPYNLEREPSQTLPEDCFVTCSSDDTIRVWGLDGCANNDIYRKNIYSKELLKIIYSDNELLFIKDQGSLFDKTGGNSSYDGRNGVRCIKISPELQHLASGDRCGNIRVYNLQTLKLITAIEAHDTEVLCLEYSNDKIERKLLASASRDRLIHVFDVAQNYLLLQTLDDHSAAITSIKFVGAGLNFQMISCGVDKSIMFRSFQGNIFMRGANTSGKTTLYDMEVDSNSKHILTACQDRNVRVYGTQNAKQTKTFKGSHSDEGSVIKLSLDPSGIYVATSCTDKTLAVYDYYSSECMARMYGHSELVTGLKFTNDCRHLISASGDGCIFIWQVPHDMIVTMQARMSQQRLRSGHPPLQRPLAPISPPGVESPTSDVEHQQQAPKFVVASEEQALPNRNAYRLSDVGQLPQWAMRKAAAEADSGALSIPTPASAGGNGSTAAMHAASSMGNLSSSPSQQLGVAAPRARGRWAQRSSQLDADDLRSNSESPLGTVSSVGGHSAGTVQTSDYNSASSKDIMYNQTYLSEDSSIDSGMETRRELKFIGSNNNGTMPSVPSAVATSNGGLAPNSAQQRLLPDKRKPGLRFDTHTHDHDGDVEDISDGERTSSDHGMFYNNLAPSTPTDFKVTAMNEDELRKSVRRQKFEKSGLQLSTAGGNGSSHTASTGTGTGTSDTEDEGSTPSAENAERSLASTLGGSNENLPQSSGNSFLQAALPEGPGLLLERGTSSRRSISAKHNTENGKGIAVAPPTITKSYTSTKKEELLQVINKVKQQLENGTRKNGVKKLNAIAEVGHRPLRGSHSISDLSLAANLDGARQAGGPGRYTKPVASHITPQYISAPTTTATIPKQQPQQQQQQQQQVYNNATQYFNCAAPKSKLQQNFQTMRQVQQHYPPYPHHVGVHQIHPPPGVPFAHANASCAAGSRTYGSQTAPRLGAKRNPAGNNRRTPSILKHYKSCPVSPVHEEVEWSAEAERGVVAVEPKRHSVYADDARTILDMIHADTEKMIDEITRKYGDLDELPAASALPASCSMPANLRGLGSTGESTPTATPPRGRTQYYVYREFYQCERKVSLSDILQPEQFAASQQRLEEARFLETQRHSSASFFLSSAGQLPHELSQESLLSDGGSYCNSLESVLSDESDCKSAPLEQPIHTLRHAGIRNFIIHGPVSKSYGNSPNAYGGFDYYMRQAAASSANYDSFDVTGYNLEPLKPSALPSSKTYPRLAAAAAPPPAAATHASDHIPTLRSKNKQYNSGVNKSLSSDFAQQRQQRNSNPLAQSQQRELFVRKPLQPKPPVPAKPHNLVSTLSCSVEKQQQRQKQSRTASVVQQFEHNLLKFEHEKQRAQQQRPLAAMRNSVSSGALATTQSCLKKVSRFDTSESSRRATSVRQKTRPKISVRFNTVSQIKYTPSAKRQRDINSNAQAQAQEEVEQQQQLELGEQLLVGSLPSDYGGERSFEMYFQENGNAPENLEHMQSYTKPGMQSVVDEIQQARVKHQKNLDNVERSGNSTSHQCQSIAKKIDIIEKLIDMEERKMEQIRLATETRLRPFACNSKQKGYVKSLTMNFDMLAKAQHQEEQQQQQLEQQLNANDAELCAYARHIRRNCSLPDVLESADFAFGQEVELAKEVIADDDKQQQQQQQMAASKSAPNAAAESSQGNPKTLNPMPIEESSIRRACSLSDLHMGNFGKPSKTNGTPQKPMAQHRNGNVSRSASKRNSLQGKSGLGASSNSMNVLNQGSDSEPEDSNRMRSMSNGQSRTNGPIAANRQYNNKLNNVNSNRRKAPNFGTGTALQDDSSSEETPNNAVNNKPVVPPRPRNLGFDHKVKLMGNSPSSGTGKQRAGAAEDYETTDPEAQVHNVINKLYTTTQTAMQLHANLKNSLLLKELENAVIMSRNMLGSITHRQNEKTLGANGSVGAGGLQQQEQLSAATTANLDNGGYMTMVNNCADLLSNLRTKHKPDDCENNS